MQTITISVSPAQATRIQHAVEAGGYASHSDVLRDALQLWEQREEVRAHEIGELKRAYHEGIASGPGREVDADILLAEFKAKAGSRG